jgi:hypothetical protein
MIRNHSASAGPKGALIKSKRRPSLGGAGGSLTASKPRHNAASLNWFGPIRLNLAAGPAVPHDGTQPPALCHPHPQHFLTGEGGRILDWGTDRTCVASQRRRQCGRKVSGRSGPTRSTRLLVEFVAKGAPRQGTNLVQATVNRISGWDAPSPQYGETLVTEHVPPAPRSPSNVQHEQAVLLAFRCQRFVLSCHPSANARSKPAT